MDRSPGRRARGPGWIGSLSCLAGLFELVGLVGLAGCGGSSGGTIIVVTLTGVDPSTSSLRATSYLNGTREQDPDVVAGNVTEIGIRLPTGASGTYQIDIEALGGDGCSFAVGSGETQLTGASVIDLTIPVMPLAVRTCALLVSTSGVGLGWVSSTPTGILCGSQGDDQCFGQFQQGLTVLLTANPEISASFAGWSLGCQGTAPCQIVMSGPAQVGAAFSVKPSQ